MSDEQDAVKRIGPGLPRPGMDNPDERHRWDRSLASALRQRLPGPAPKPICIRCNRTPDQIDEYVEAAIEADTTPDRYVRAEEGTYNAVNGHFACTVCYFALVMPSAPGNGWKAP